MTTTSLVVVGAVLGLLIGSFVNVVAYRVPAGISVVRPPSACPECRHEIRARHNLPVLGWLLLRGRCFDCDAPIAGRYPLVEAATAGLFAAAAAVVGPNWVLPAYWWFVAVTVSLALTDLDVKRLPNRILYPGVVVGAALLTAGALADGAPGSLAEAAAGAVGYFGLLLIIALAARGGFGFGDVKLAVLLGLFVGYRSWESVPVAAFGAFVLGGLIAVILLASRRAGRTAAIPFGPSMIVASYLAIVWGEPIVEWYLG